MTLDEIKKYVETKLNKNQNGYVLTPDRFNLLLKALNVEYYEEKVQKSTAPNVGYEFTKKHIDLFRDFKKIIPIPLTEGGNFPIPAVADLPEDYRHYSSVYYNFYMQDGCELEISPKKVTFVKDSKIPDRLQSTIQPPTLKHPIWTLRDGQIVVYPKEIKKLLFTYLSKPPDAVFDYTIINSNPVYLPPGELHPNSSVKPVNTPSASVELPYPENYHIEIADWLYSFSSGVLKDMFNKQLSQQKDAVR